MFDILSDSRPKTIELLRPHVNPHRVLRGRSLGIGSVITYVIIVGLNDCWEYFIIWRATSQKLARSQYQKLIVPYLPFLFYSLIISYPSNIQPFKFSHISIYRLSCFQKPWKTCFAKSSLSSIKSKISGSKDIFRY